MYSSRVVLLSALAGAGAGAIGKGGSCEGRASFSTISSIRLVAVRIRGVDGIRASSMNAFATMRSRRLR